MGNSKEYLDRHREEINERRRHKYDADARKRKYLENRDAILQKCKEDKAMCPICQIEYHRPYLKTHLTCRHKMGEREAKIYCDLRVNINF